MNIQNRYILCVFLSLCDCIHVCICVCLHFHPIISQPFYRARVSLLAFFLSISATLSPFSCRGTSPTTGGRIYQKSNSAPPWAAASRGQWPVCTFWPDTISWYHDVKTSMRAHFTCHCPVFMQAMLVSSKRLPALQRFLCHSTFSFIFGGMPNYEALDMPLTYAQSVFHPGAKQWQDMSPLSVSSVVTCRNTWVPKTHRHHKHRDKG